jgi:hypothetical protein
LVELPNYSADDVVKSKSIWTLCIAPNALQDFNLVVTRAERFVANASPDRRHYWLTVLGAALYRAGRYKQADERLDESGVVYSSSLPGPFFDVRNYQRLFLAMTKWQLGQRDDARRLLGDTLPVIDKELQSLSIVWNRRATLELLRAEAQALIGPKEANEAVEKGGPSPDEVKP